jgi:hypothetical protein
MGERKTKQKVMVGKPDYYTDLTKVEWQCPELIRLQKGTSGWFL